MADTCVNLARLPASGVAGTDSKRTGLPRIVLLVGFVFVNSLLEATIASMSDELITGEPFIEYSPDFFERLSDRLSDDGTVLAFIGLALIAVYLLLGVRIVNRRERWAKRAAVGLAVALATYVLSVGPAFWFVCRGYLPMWAVESNFYLPAWLIVTNCPTPMQDAFFWWFYLGI